LIIIIVLLDTTVQGVTLELKIPKVKGSSLFIEEQATKIETYLRSKNEKKLSTEEEKNRAQTSVKPLYHWSHSLT
jgi:hypothetical protein